MEVLTNGRVLALVVGRTLFLPTGRAVPLDTTGWEPSDAEPEEAMEACLAAARVAEEAEVAFQAQALAVPRVRDALPELPRPVPFVESADLVEFRDRCVALQAVIRGFPTWRQAYGEGRAEQLEALRVTTHAPSDAMWELLQQMESELTEGPAEVEAFATLCETYATRGDAIGAVTPTFLRSTARAVRQSGYITRKTRDAVHRTIARIQADEARAEHARSRPEGD